jgi:hypothetical protein
MFGLGQFGPGALELLDQCGPSLGLVDDSRDEQPEQQGQAELEQRRRQDFADGLAVPAGAPDRGHGEPGGDDDRRSDSAPGREVGPDLREQHEQQDVLGVRPTLRFRRC